MANKIQIRRGLKQDLPILSVGEPALTLDTSEFFIGDGTLNIELAKKGYVDGRFATIDEQINDITTNGISKLASYTYDLYATIDNQTVFEIPYDLFETNTDTLMVYFDGMKRPLSDYVVTNPVDVGGVITKGYITLSIGRPLNSYVGLVILKNVVNDAYGVFSGSLIAEESIPVSKVIGLQEDLDNVSLTMGNTVSFMATNGDEDALDISEYNFTGYTSDLVDLEDIDLLERMFTEYKDFDMIEEVFDDTTPIVDVATAMVDYSVLIAQVYNTNVVYPSSTGTIRITKVNINRVILEFMNTSGTKWVASYGSIGGFSGWKQLALNSDVVTNATNIASNTTSIATHTASISTNATNITTANTNIAQLSNPNLLINGDFQVWQRGITPFASSGGVVYTADRWAYYRGMWATGGTAESYPSSNGTEYLIRSQINNGYGHSMQTILEGEQIKNLRGKFVTLSFTARTGGGIADANMSSQILVSRGNGTCHIGGAWDYTIGSVNHGNITSIATRYVNTSTVFVPTDAVNISIFVNCALNGITSEHYFAVSQVKLEVGQKATPFSPRPYAEELAICRRYYESFQQTLIISNKISSGNKHYCSSINISEKRVQPTMGYSGVNWVNVATLSGSAMTTLNSYTNHVICAIDTTGYTYTNADVVDVTGYADAEIY